MKTHSAINLRRRDWATAEDLALEWNTNRATVYEATRRADDPLIYYTPYWAERKKMFYRPEAYEWLMRTSKSNGVKSTADPAPHAR